MDDPFAELRAEYASLLPGYASELRAIVRAADWAEAALLAHRLAGTAGSYGFRDTGAIARRIELAIEARDGEVDALLDVLDGSVRAAVGAEAP